MGIKTLTGTKRDRRIRILQHTVTNTLGDATATYVEIATQPWASFRTLRASERVDNGTNLAQAEVEFQIQQSTDYSWLTPADRIEFGGREFDIVSIEELGRNQGWAIKCKVRDAING